MFYREGIASAEDIDKGMMLGAGHPIGPLALADLIGLDTMLFVVETLYYENELFHHLLAPLLKNMYELDVLEEKTGEGFFKY